MKSKIKSFKELFEASSNLEYYEVEINGIPFRVGGYYEKEEKEVLYYPDGSGQPGYPSSFDIIEIYTRNESEKEDKVDDDYLRELGVTKEELESAVLEQIEGGDEWDYKEDLVDDL